MQTMIADVKGGGSTCADLKLDYRTVPRFELLHLGEIAVGWLTLLALFTFKFSNTQLDHVDPHPKGICKNQPPWISLTSVFSVLLLTLYMRSQVI